VKYPSRGFKLCLDPFTDILLAWGRCANWVIQHIFSAQISEGQEWLPSFSEMREQKFGRI